MFPMCSVIEALGWLRWDIALVVQSGGLGNKCGLLSACSVLKDATN